MKNANGDEIRIISSTEIVVGSKPSENEATAGADNEVFPQDDDVGKEVVDISAGLLHRSKTIKNETQQHVLSPSFPAPSAS